MISLHVLAEWNGFSNLVDFLNNRIQLSKVREVFFILFEFHVHVIFKLSWNANILFSPYFYSTEQTEKNMWNSSNIVSIHSDVLLYANFIMNVCIRWLLICVCSNLSVYIPINTLCWYAKKARSMYCQCMRACEAFACLKLHKHLSSVTTSFPKSFSYAFSKRILVCLFCFFLLLLLCLRLSLCVYCIDV